MPDCMCMTCCKESEKGGRLIQQQQAVEAGVRLFQYTLDAARLLCMAVTVGLPVTSFHAVTTCSMLGDRLESETNLMAVMFFSSFVVWCFRQGNAGGRCW